MLCKMPPSWETMKHGIMFLFCSAQYPRRYRKSLRLITFYGGTNSAFLTDPWKVRRAPLFFLYESPPSPPSPQEISLFSSAFLQTSVSNIYYTVLLHNASKGQEASLLLLRVFFQTYQGGTVTCSWGDFNCAVGGWDPSVWPPRGVNRGTQIRRSVFFFFTKSVDPPKFLFKSEITTTSGNRSVKVQR